MNGQNDIIVDCREVIAIYADDDGYLHKKDLVDAIRSLQIALTDKEFKEMLEK